MEHKGTIRLETERLVLRRFRIEDAAAMYKNWANDPEVTKYLTWPVHENVEVSEGVLKSWISQYDDPANYQWAIEPRELGEPIGSIGVVKRDDSIAMAHIGYCIAQAWWGKGITTEALGAVIRYLLDEVGINRIEARHDPENPASGKVMLKCGLQYEGTMRQADRNNRGVCDYSMYGLLAKDRVKRSSR